MSDTAREERVRELAARHTGTRGGLLPALHAVQDEHGWIDPADGPVLAEAFGLSAAEVHGVVSFYPNLRTAPPCAHEVRVCRGEACQAVGAERLRSAAREACTGRPDVEVGEVFCLGLCALGPALLVDGRAHGRVDADRVAALLPPVGP